jgi:hypothetical protein
MRSPAIFFLCIFLIPIAFFLPNIYRGGVMLPLDLLYHLQPFASSVPSVLEKVHNSGLSDLITLYHPSIELARTSGCLVPLWNPFSFFGVPALANAQGGGLFPLNFLFKFLSPGNAYLLIALSKMWFSGFFAFLYFRKAGFQALSACLGSIGFMLCGHMIVWFGYPTSNPLMIFPFLMWALEGFLENATLRRLAWVAVAFGLLFIGGQPQTGFLITTAAAIYLLIRSVQPGKRIVRIWIGFTVAVILGLCLAAPQIMTFLEYLRLSASAEIRGSMGHYGWKYYEWFTLISWIQPLFFGDVRGGSFWGFSSLLGEAVYIGAIPLVFAFFGFSRLRDRQNYGFAVLAIFLLGCLGLYIKPMAGIYLSLPLLSRIDNNKLMTLVAFGLIAFSVIGFDALLEGAINLHKTIRNYLWIAFGWIGLVAFGFFYFRDGIHALGMANHEIHEAAWLVGFLILGVMVLWLLKAGRLSRNAAACLLLLATLVDVFRIWIYYIPSNPEEFLIPKSEALAYLQKNAGNSRIMGVRDMLPPEISILYRLQDMRGYDGMTPYSYYRVLEKIDPDIHDLSRNLQLWRVPGMKWAHSTLFFKSYSPYLDSPDLQVKKDLSRIDYWSNGISAIQRPELLSIFGVRFILCPKGSEMPDRAGFRKVHQSDAEVWENPKVLPRAYLVTGPVIVGDDEAALQTIANPDFAFNKTAVITGKKEVTEHAPESELIPAVIEEYDSEKVRVKASSPQGGWLILSDLYYPGWEATCDGRPAEILPANYLFRAIRIPAGTHTVEYIYRPASFRIGCWLALVSGIIVIGLFSLRKWNSHEAD